MRPEQHRQGDGAAKSGARLKVGFVLSRSFTLSAFALFVDTLRLASDEQDRSGRVLADWQVILSVILASLFGLFVGAVPGLSATMATALLVLPPGIAH